MFEGAVAVTDDLIEAIAIGVVQDDADGLGHDHRLTHPTRDVNLPSASMH